MYRFSPKLILIIASGRPTSVPNFSWIEYEFPSYNDLFKCAKRRRKNSKFAHSYLGNALRDFLQIRCVVSLGRRAPLQQLWYSSDKRSWSYECVKIATLLFPLIYSRSLRVSCFLEPYDTLTCVVIISVGTATIKSIETSCQDITQTGCM